MNRIHPSARIADGAELGIGNFIGENVRIACKKFHMGDDCKLHNHVFIDGDEVWLGDNVWVGQYSHLDGVGKLDIYDDVTIGYNCHIWTHADRSGMPEGCLLTGAKSTRLLSGVWLMGCNVVVNPGVEMAERSIALANSVITKNTKPYRVYGGVPAVELDIKAWE